MEEILCHLGFSGWSLGCLLVKDFFLIFACVLKQTNTTPLGGEERLEDTYVSVVIWRIHPGRLTWNLKTTQLKRKIIFQTIIFRFHVNLPGCICFRIFRLWRCAHRCYGNYNRSFLARFPPTCAFVFKTRNHVQGPCDQIAGVYFTGIIWGMSWTRVMNWHWWFGFRS